ncbi:MAG: Ribonuclease HII [Parcubacteria group bacterium GW2011_GWB1_40_5]|nr:MAG: Ribonuclease HII [Parcubacteria group bacterium GW2011_GWB1_40_5]
MGIDEVGRGPLAGPVTVGIAVCELGLYKKLKKDRYLPPTGKDSKKLSPELRQQYAKYLKILSTRFHLVQKGNLEYIIIHVSNKVIDEKGIAFCIRKAINQGIKKLNLNPKQCEVLLDGGLRAPSEFTKQRTIIKGDEKERIIAWASILAKVSRDALMCKLAKKYPQYGFESHKGYGTKQHCKAVSKCGLSSIHRKTFCKRFR